MITFIKTRHIYQSYTDLWELVKLSNFPTIYVDELNIKDDGVYILPVMNGEWRPHLDNQSGRRNAHLIFWNLERPSGNGSVREYARSSWELIHNRYIDEVWVSDSRLADEITARFVRLGSHPELGFPGNKDEKQFDFIHLSYVVPRRQSIYRYINSMAPNAWPPERDLYLKQSRFAINVHQDQFPFQEPLRFALFAANALPIISEKIYNPDPWGKGTMLFANYHELPDLIRMVLQGPYEQYYEMGLRGWDLLCKKYTFKEMVNEAVHESVGDWR